MFDDARFADDLAHSDHTGRQIAHAARALSSSATASRHDCSRAATPRAATAPALAGMVKLYLPIPYGDRFGLVVERGRNAHGLYLLAVAFGQRHLARRPSVSDIARYRRHGQWPSSMR